jgi:hypothetical protein
MAKTAVTLLQDQIEMIRREAYAAGYAAAMQAIRTFAARPPGSAPPTRRDRGAAEAPKPVTRRRGRPSSTTPPLTRQRPNRGTNVQLIAEVLKACRRAQHAQPTSARRCRATRGWRWPPPLFVTRCGSWQAATKSKPRPTARPGAMSELLPTEQYASSARLRRSASGHPSSEEKPACRWRSNPSR